MDKKYEFSHLPDDEIGERIDQDKTGAKRERQEKAALLKKARDFVWKGRHVLTRPGLNLYAAACAGRGHFSRYTGCG